MLKICFDFSNDLCGDGLVQLSGDKTIPLPCPCQCFCDSSEETAKLPTWRNDPTLLYLEIDQKQVNLRNLNKLVLAHNKITSVPSTIANFLNLEILNLFNNNIEELPTTLSSMPKLRILNCGMNKMSTIPRGFGVCPVLEVLDLTYNNLSENSLPANFFCLDTLRALYLGDNDFEIIPPEIGRLKNLQILVLRDNDLIALPKEVGELVRLRELHIQGNRLTVLPPEMGNLDLIGTKQIFKAEGNPWVTPIADQFQVGISHVFDYIRSDTYKYLYDRHITARAEPPPKTNDKSHKISRMKK